MIHVGLRFPFDIGSAKTRLYKENQRKSHNERERFHRGEFAWPRLQGQEFIESHSGPAAMQFCLPSSKLSAQILEAQPQLTTSTRNFIWEHTKHSNMLNMPATRMAQNRWGSPWQCWPS